MKRFIYSFFFVGITLSSELHYCLPIGICDDSKVLFHSIHNGDVSVRIAPSLELLMNADHKQLAALPLATSFSTFPVQPVLFFKKEGFSYFDQGVLKKKHFALRSPGSIYTEIPFDHTMGIHWYCQNQGVMSILKNKFYVVYNLCLDDGTMRLLIDNSSKKEDVLFPFIFQESIFYVLQSASSSKSSSKIVVCNRRGTKVLFETGQSKIVFFCFTTPSSGIFVLYNSHTFTDKRACTFQIYHFEYNYQVNSFDIVPAIKTEIQFNTLQDLLSNNLFPWCFWPIKFDSKTYVLRWENQLIQAI